MSVPTVGCARIGNLEVSRLGLGAMVLTRSFGAPDPSESAATFDAALDAGVNFVDTADSYGAGENEEFVGRMLRGRRKSVVLATKFGLVATPDGRIVVNGRPDYVRSACEQSLRRLGVDHIDLYYQHRVDPDVPIAETVGAMAGLVAAGKVRHLGLCEADADQLRRATAVHPIAALQSEWSLWARQVEEDVLLTARELGVGVVAYSPLGRGFLTGFMDTETSLSADDLRGADPRLEGSNRTRNLELVARLQEMAEAMNATPAQLALAWLVSKGKDVVPIPGMERRQLLDENVACLAIRLAAPDVEYLDSVFSPGVAAGDPDETLLRGRSVIGSGGLQI